MFFCLYNNLHKNNIKSIQFRRINKSEIKKKLKSIIKYFIQ